MAQKQGGSPGKRRKRGDWIPIAKARDNSAKDGKREIVNGSGVNNVPSVKDVGSAAYRRRMTTRKSGKGSQQQ